jgi:hypothetical protein
MFGFQRLSFADGKKKLSYKANEKNKGKNATQSEASHRI